MGLKFSTEVRTASLDAITASMAGTPILKISTPTSYPWYRRVWLWLQRKPTKPPVRASLEDAGTVLATYELPPDWMPGDPITPPGDR